MPRRLEYEDNHSAAVSSNSDDPLQRGLVEDVRRQWVVHEDAILANRLQDNEFERKYNRNLAERQIAKQDVRLARQVQTTDEERAQRTRRHQQQRTRNIVDDDAIIAEQLQSEEFIKKEQERAISELKDEEMARRLQEKEKRRYELRLREKELRKQRKMLEAELKLESNGLRENTTTSSSVVEMAIAAPARERSPDLEGAVGNDLDFFVPPSGNISGHDRKGLQHLQDEDLARRLQNEEQKLQSKLEKLKEIELRDAELAKIMQEQEHLKMQKRRRGQRPRDTRQSSDPCHASESHLPEARQSHSLPQPHDLPQGNDDPPNNFPFRDVGLPQVGLPDHESGRTGHPARFVSRPLPDTPSPELPRGCNMSLLRALERDADEGLSHRMNVSTSCQMRDARRMPLLLSDDEDLLPPLPLPPPSNAKKSSPSTNANIFAEIDPTWNQGQMRHAEEVPSKSSPGNHRQSESEALEDGYCDLEDVRALRVVMSSDGEDLGMVPGQRRQPFNRKKNTDQHRTIVGDLQKMNADIAHSFDELKKKDEKSEGEGGGYQDAAFTGRSREFEGQLMAAAGKLLLLRADHFQITSTTKEMSVEQFVNETTRTQRYVHAPEGSSFEVECSPNGNQSLPDFSWKIGLRKEENISVAKRLTVGDVGELIFSNINAYDSGNYFCIGERQNNTFEHHVTLYVFRAAELTVGIPFVFKSIHCNKQHLKEIAVYMTNVLEKRIDPSYFDSAVSCTAVPWYNQDSKNAYQAEISVIVQLLPEVTTSSLDCNNECALIAQLKNILSDMTQFAIAFVEIGTLLGVDSGCGGGIGSKGCIPSYVMKPLRSFTHLQIVYTCEPGFILYMTSSCNGRRRS